MIVVSNTDKPYQIFLPDGEGNTKLGIIRSGERGNVNTKFRYFRLKVFDYRNNEGYRDGDIIQFSKLKFMTENELTTYKYCDQSNYSDIRTCVWRELNFGAECQGSDTKIGETAWEGLCDIGKKACIQNLSSVSKTNPFILTYDLDRAQTGRRLDLSIYSKWCWYTSNDTLDRPDRNMRIFSIEVSTDKETWLQVDYADLTGQEIEENNNSLVYVGHLELPEPNY